jgi:hypothetical protein
MFEPLQKDLVAIAMTVTGTIMMSWLFLWTANRRLRDSRAKR